MQSEVTQYPQMGDEFLHPIFPIQHAWVCWAVKLLHGENLHRDLPMQEFIPTNEILTSCHSPHPWGHWPEGGETSTPYPLNRRYFLIKYDSSAASYLSHPSACLMSNTLPCFLWRARYVRDQDNDLGGWYVPQSVSSWAQDIISP